MIRDYIEVLKPRPTLLLTFIGIVAAIVAGNGYPPVDLLLLSGIAILVASAGANGLTNYLDRDVDARVQRTRNRALPAGRITPPERVLPLVIGLIIAGLVLTWELGLLCFAADLTGTLAAGLWRKRATCVFPQGVVASWSPVLIGWLAIKPDFSWELVLLLVLISVWLPLHVWSVMIANREDYLQAGLNYFPMSWEVKGVVRVLLIFSVLLGGASIALSFIGGFGWLYLILASLLGILMVYATIRLAFSNQSQDAWRLYKLSSYPYLGLIFLAMCLDIWLL